jgi:acetoin:2,6-dichlorophenolindophenol oxidoreductase subunit alpha
MATDVYCAAASARERALDGGGPAVIYARTYRYEGHYYGDRHRRYRTVAEVESWQARDPLEMHRQKLQEFGIDEGTILGISETAKRKSAAAFDRARAGRQIVMADILDDLVADPLSGELRR